MKFPPSVLDDIKARLPVSTVVGRRVRLQKAGREWKGLSPFGKERTPSFFVNDTKQAWFDFSSGRNGDIFTFLMETEGLSFPEAVERLAAEAGVTLPRVSAETPREVEVRKGLHDVIELAACFFEAQLAAPAGREARAYLEGRGLMGEAARQFRLGYAPSERFALRDHLAAQNVSLAQMIEAGLLIHGEDIAVPYDRFRDRVMFPIHDAKGRVIAFGGRALSAQAQAKYLNTAETVLFRKGQLLFNHHNARKAAHEAGTVIAVEGYVDVIAMTMAGFAHTVAPLGTALTEEQLALLWRMADEPVLCFDGDQAGRKAAHRAIDAALPVMEPGKSLRFALLPDGQDPDDLVRTGGREAIARVIEGARPLADMIWQREVEAAPLDTPERRAAFERRLSQVLAMIRDEATRRHYRSFFEDRLAQLFPPPQRGMGGAPGQRRGAAAGRSGGSGAAPWLGPAASLQRIRAGSSLARSALFVGHGVGESPREAAILLGLASRPELLAEFADDLAEMDWQGRAARVMCQALLQAVVDGQTTPEAVAARLAGRAAIEARAALGRCVRHPDLARIAAKADHVAAARVIRQAFVLHRRARTLHSELKAAEQALAVDQTETNLAWLQDVKDRLASLEGTEAQDDGA